MRFGGGRYHRRIGQLRVRCLDNSSATVELPQVSLRPINRDRPARQENGDDRENTTLRRAHVQMPAVTRTPRAGTGRLACQRGEHLKIKVLRL